MTNTTREGRYTGPSLQADAVAKAYEPAYAVLPARAKLSRDAQSIADLQSQGGIVAFGAWQTGTGNYKKARAVPEGAVVWSKLDTESRGAEFGLPVRLPRAPEHVCAWFAAHPRAQRCVAIA